MATPNIEAAKPAHTPGRWALHTAMGDGDFHWIVPADAPDFRIAKVEVFAPSLTTDCDNDMEAEGLANARLIAAAPELLTALIWAEAAIAPFSKDPQEKSGILMVRAAIAKALGQ